MDRDQFFKATFSRKTIKVGEAGTVLIRELSAHEQENYAKQALGRDGKPNLHKATDLNARLIAMACINEDGSPIFTNADISEISKMPGQLISELGNQIRILSGMQGKDPYSRETLEELDDTQLSEIAGLAQEILANGPEKKVLSLNGDSSSG